MWDSLEENVTAFGRMKFFLIGLVGSILSMIVFVPLESRMRQSGYSILDFQLAWSTERMASIIASWRPIMGEVFLFMAIDMIYPTLYFMTLSGLVLLINDGRKRLDIQHGLIFALASILDYMENVFTFVILLGGPLYLTYAISLFATLKFVLLVIGFLLLIGRVLVNLL